VANRAGPTTSTTAEVETRLWSGPSGSTRQVFDAAPTAPGIPEAAT
jgi:hypothetical protein